MMTTYAPSRLLPLIEHRIGKTAGAGLMMLTADSTEYAGRQVQIGGRVLLNFGGCSYLGLEQRPELNDAAVRAIRRYGTQFSYSRAYLQSPLYLQLESALEAMTGGFPLVAPSTTLAHMAALPVLVHPGDAVLIDVFTHASVKMATCLLDGIPVATVPHFDIDRLEQKIARLACKHRRVWLLLDGLYSMYGDFAPVSDLAALMQKYPTLHLYVDDAHSTSWLGKHGRGFILEHFADRRRIVAVLSLNKAFSAGGGAVIFSDAEDRTRVQRCGGPMLFSGPVPPPMLGAAVASAELHLRPDFSELQKGLTDRIDLVLSLARQLDIRFVTNDRSPMFFVPCGELEAMFRFAQGLRARGIYTCPGGFPAVPKGQEGIRFTVSLSNTEMDIRHLMESISSEQRNTKGRSDAPSGKRVRAATPSARAVADGRSR
ncbi:aminotransferase class I/II-fold pyridoxal phosphate-dependent enzyme [Pendulispora rubella]|uniref:Aminotransferase class I/II-fold pyridoxal phosphate-dependent enzyme n=1 Tax=Pendulispora rubella TaxID=2741070 RepID=A0ABZ2LEU3_9BACT